MNEDYFRNKLHVGDNFKPNDRKLKLPSTFGKSTYNKEIGERN